VLVISAGIAKPHLALGLLAFLVGWRDRRVILGACAGGAGLVLASLALVGPSGVAGFVNILASSTTRWDLATMVSFIGVAGSVFGNGLAAHLIGLVASLLACAAAVWLGMTVRRDRSHLDTALVGAVVLSLVASPHAYPDDLVMLAPALVIGVAAAARRIGSTAPLTFTSPVTVALGAWALITVAACIDLIDAATFPPGQLAGWALLIAGALACAATRRAPELAGVPRTRVAGLGGAQTRS
jgi:hypothetical protein